MDARRTLVVVSAAQLACGVGGLAVGIARRRAYDLPLLHGDPAKVLRDAVPLGTALSAPAPMLVAQAVATAALAKRPDQRAARTLGVLGLLMVPGYLAERLVRRRLTGDGFDSIESPIAAAGISLAAVMAALGTRPAPQRGTPGSSPLTQTVGA